MNTESILKRLRTGYLPTPSDLERIHTDLALLSTELTRLDSQIREFTAQRDRIKADIDLKTALISPVRRLSDNVVQEIFLACLPTHRNATMSPCEAPLLLCQIISTWRALALSIPPLWSSLRVPLEFVLQTNERARVVAQWLERSAGCPLSLFFFFFFFFWSVWDNEN
ncbi:hypothetical protein C8R43DRAFT_892613 [Mycena crocata]|nr:hypothetical protein C8R43DRAFT_892613 [Mycena crocata]